jgi:hypothetical protein
MDGSQQQTMVWKYGTKQFDCQSSLCSLLFAISHWSSHTMRIMIHVHPIWLLIWSFPKSLGYPQIIDFSRIFHYNPSSYWGIPHLWIDLPMKTTASARPFSSSAAVVEAWLWSTSAGAQALDDGVSPYGQWDDKWISWIYWWGHPYDGFMMGLSWKIMVIGEIYDRMSSIVMKGDGWLEWLHQQRLARWKWRKWMAFSLTELIWLDQSFSWLWAN